MNIPAIRKVLKQVVPNHTAPEDIANAVLAVGLRACDEWAEPEDGESCACYGCTGVERRLEVIADILREAGVEVGE